MELSDKIELYGHARDVAVALGGVPVAAKLLGMVPSTLDKALCPSDATHKLDLAAWVDLLDHGQALGFATDDPHGPVSPSLNWLARRYGFGEPAAIALSAEQEERLLSLLPALVKSFDRMLLSFFEAVDPAGELGERVSEAEAQKNLRTLAAHRKVLDDAERHNMTVLQRARGRVA